MINCMQVQNDVEVQHVVRNGTKQCGGATCGKQWQSERMAVMTFISVGRSNGYPKEL